MDIYICRVNGRRAILTTSPLSSYGMPVLRIEEDPPLDLGPPDMLHTDEGVKFAGQIVMDWIRTGRRTREEQTAAKKYLLQWEHIG